MKRTRTFFRIPALLLFSALLGGVAAQPAQAKLFSISPEKERKMGADAARQIESQARIVHGPVADWVNIIGQRLVAVSDPEFKYTFHVIESPEINAFALPGGYVYVYTGLRKVAQTDDELAAVIAHEITHAEQHHYAKQYKKSSKRGLLLGIGSIVAGLPNVAQQALSILDFSITQKYSRGSEAEADEMGMKRMIRAGFNPQGMVTLLQKLSQEDDDTSTLDKWFRDHPESGKRVTSAENEIGEVKTLQAQNDPTVKAAFPAWSTDTLQQLAGIQPVNIPAATTPASTIAPTASVNGGMGDSG